MIKHLAGTAIYWTCCIVAVPHIAFAAYVMLVFDPSRPMETEDRLIIAGVFAALALGLWAIGWTARAFLMRRKLQ